VKKSGSSSTGRTAVGAGPWAEAAELEFHWSDVDEHQLARAIDMVTRCGHGMVIGRTSDGGAGSICILAGETRPRIYVKDAEDAARRMDEMCDWAMAQLTP
jgi:hypothetical protein